MKRDLSTPLAATPNPGEEPKTKTNIFGTTVVTYTTKDGSKVKSKETRGGRLKETIKNEKTGYKSKQISKDGVVKKTVTKTPTSKHKEVERGKRRKVVTVTKNPETGKRKRVVTRSKI